MKPEVEATHQDQVQFGSKTITYSVERSKRTSLGISVNPDASVSVVAPYDASLVLIREKVLKRADWIIKQQLDFVEMEKPVARYNYTSGESHWYLGKQYRLKFIESDKVSVSREDRYLKIAGTRDPERVKSALNEWYRDRAKEKIEIIIGTWWSRMGGPEQTPTFSIRKLEKRWGSCTAKGQLIFNEDLIKAPSQCVEYVVVHELCHLFEHNHGPKFVALLTRHIPDWEDRKLRLERLEL
jgi:predicted metal-dependent hydrolase